jgi:hypothetical protein
MIRAAVALIVSISLLGCFPHNPKARTYAKIGEGTAILGGIAISAFANTGADCDRMAMPGIDNSDCKSQAQWLSTLGVALIVGGLLGFVATVSTAEDEDKAKPIEIKAETAKEPETTEPAPTGDTAGSAAGSAETNAAGSAAQAPSAPQR